MRTMRLFKILLVVLFLIAIPLSLAQDTGEAPVAPDADVTVATDDATWVIDDDVMLVVAGILMAVVLGGSFALAIRALEAVKVSVPPEIANSIATQIVTTMKETLAALGNQVDRTATPVDDLAYAIGRIPLELLIKEVERRTSQTAAADAFAELNQQTQTG